MERGTAMLVKVEVYTDDEFWCACGIGEDIFTQGQTVDDLYANIKEAVAHHFENIADLKK
jgi:predicted RNase H-like HicB family nuclease